MKVSKASYIDDGVNIPGVLVKRFLRKPVFYAADPSCGWSSQAITKQSNGVIMFGGCGSGKVRCSYNTQGDYQNANNAYYKAIRAAIASGKADEIRSGKCMKQVLLILDDDIERIVVRTYHRDFPGVETWDVGGDHSLDIDDGDKFDLRLDSKEEEYKE